MLYLLLDLCSRNHNVDERCAKNTTAAVLAVVSLEVMGAKGALALRSCYTCSRSSCGVPVHRRCDNTIYIPALVDAVRPAAVATTIPDPRLWLLCLISCCGVWFRLMYMLRAVCSIFF